MRKSELQYYVDKVLNLRASGKIDDKQAHLLEEALRQSEKRGEFLYKQIKEQKCERERRTWQFLGFGLVAVLFIFSLATIRFSLGYIADGFVLRQQSQKTGTIHFREGSRQGLVQTEKDINEGRGEKMTSTVFFFVVVFLVFVVSIVLTFFLILYNLLVRKEESVNESWAQIGVFLQRKIDLVPSLLKAVEDYAGHEKSTLEEVINARNEAGKDLTQIHGTGSDKKEQLERINHIQQLIDKGLNQIKALVEMYPDLKANQHYLKLQDQIEEVENSIAKARQEFNKKVKAYNISLRQFPFSLMASLGSFHMKQYFEKGEEK